MFDYRQAHNICRLLSRKFSKKSLSWRYYAKITVKVVLTLCFLRRKTKSVGVVIYRRIVG